ncbi:hypothetical protein [Actinoplanes sp. DH11]|uniref:hypothetical protein n=1 Tax=Actinoplanes sp. DH11 TaxID=2857011 RepID=UPI001E379279|nr:hypothetical protein [Actinoplanes sp. DH11]
MTEAGWPLIPREVLPPPVPVVRRTARRGASSRKPGRQLPMFGAETTEPSPADLAGLLAGPGRLDRMGGTARVSVRVDAAWRVHVLVSEFVARGLTATWAPADEPEAPTDEPEAAAETEECDAPESGTPVQLFDVRTAYSRRLNALANAWPQAAAQLFLSGPRLRLWVAAAGGPRPGGYALSLNPAADTRPVEAALIRAGLAGRLSEDGRVWLVTGRRRLTRLAELVGERPSAAPEELWPGGAPA